MKKNIIIGVLLVFNVFLCIMSLLNRTSNIDSQVLSGRFDNYLLDEYCVEEFKRSFSYSIINQGRLFHITDSIKDQLVTFFPSGNEKKLFFRLDFPYCGACIFPVIEMLSKNEIINNEEIIILSAFPSDRHMDDEFIHFMRDKNIKIINIPDFDMTFDPTGFAEPYLFIMGSSLIPKKLFVVNQCNGFLLETYLYLIRKHVV